jgi:hypothetical protein
MSQPLPSTSPLALFSAAMSLYIIPVIERDIAAAGLNMSATLVPGMLVRHPERPDWGVGQVQSVVGARITVNFENAGKLLINGAVVALETAEDELRQPT